MNEMKLKIEAPELVAAIEKLAAILPVGQTLTDLTDIAPITSSALQPPVTAPEVAATSPATADSAPVSGPPAVPVEPSMPVAPAAPPTPVVPVAGAPTYNLDQIAKAGASLVDAGKMEQLLALLGKYGIQAITQLQPDQYGVFATELRTLGAQI